MAADVAGIRSTAGSGGRDLERVSREKGQIEISGIALVDGAKINCALIENIWFDLRGRIHRRQVRNPKIT